MNFRGVTSGILDTVFDPRKGLLLPMKYSSDDQSGKQVCKERLLQTYGISGDPYICLLMCRLVEEKGIDEVLNVVEDIKNSGGVLVVVGKGYPKYEKRFKEFNRSDGVVYLDK
jgi:starch synthase